MLPLARADMVVHGRRETAVKKQEMLQVVRQMCEAFEEERRQMEEKYAQAALMLRQVRAHRSTLPLLLPHTVRRRLRTLITCDGRRCG